jgi:hypothetical protein
VDYVSNDYAVFYTELENALPLSLERQPYYSIPSLFTIIFIASFNLKTNG